MVFVSMAATDTARIPIDPQLALVIDDEAELRQFIGAALAQLNERPPEFHTRPGT